jgi:hypothetical protein
MAHVKNVEIFQLDACHVRIPPTVSHAIRLPALSKRLQMEYVNVLTSTISSKVTVFCVMERASAKNALLQISV